MTARLILASMRIKGTDFALRSRRSGSVTEIAESVFAEGFIYDGTAYYPVIHFDSEPFRQVYHNTSWNNLVLRGTIGSDKNSSALPGKNTSWAMLILPVASYLDRINPCSMTQTVFRMGRCRRELQTADEYNSVVCVFGTGVCSKQHWSWFLPQFLVIDSSYYDGNESFPENGGYVYIHLTDIENSQRIKGIEEANALGANINSAIWNFYYFCGDAENFSRWQSAYDYKAAQSFELGQTVCRFRI